VSHKYILIFCWGDYGHDKYYKEAVEALGFTAGFIYPQLFDEGIKNQIDKCGGVVLAGGGDIHPKYFAPREEPHKTLILVDEQRDKLELNAIPYIIEKKKPILAICRGMQVLNCALGGDIYQDIDDHLPERVPKIGHRQTEQKIPRRRTSHEVILEENSIILKILGKRKTRVNSTHHQAIRKLGKGLRVTGRSPDGIAEVAEMPGCPHILAVQFHPERLWKRYKDMRKIFEYFAEVVNQ